MGRRIVAVVLPQLGCELVRQRIEAQGPLAVLFTKRAGGEGEGEGEAERVTATLDLVDDLAFRYGIRPGQRVAEAQATLAELTIQSVPFAEVDAALGRVAEVCLGVSGQSSARPGESMEPSTGLGTTAAIRLVPETPDEARGPAEDTPFDTVFLDVTGVAHLVGGEEALLDELCERIAALGHRVQAAIADGPRIARALARFARSPALTGPSLSVRKAPHPTVVSKPGARVLGPLPITALPLDADLVAFFGRLGIFTVEALAKLPRAELAARLGRRAVEVLDLASGHDERPLVPYTPPRAIVEEASFEDPITGVEPILFVLRAMTSRVAARLGARGEACLSLEMVIALDRSIARLRDPGRDPLLALRIELPSPLASAGDLHRALRAKLERAELFAPATDLRLEVSGIIPQAKIQIDLSRDKAVRPDALPSLLAELSAEIGAERVGVLEVVAAHRPEARSKLVPVGARKSPPPALDPRATEDDEVPLPTRLLPTPVPIGRVQKGAVIAVDNRLYAIEALRFVMRLDGVEWWTRAPASRDYGVAWLVPGKSADGRASRAPTLAWVYVDRTSGEGYLQGFCE